MTWRNFVSRLPITAQRRGLTTATLYGLSLAVRFTSAAGRDDEVPTQSLQMIKPVTSIMVRTAPRLPYEDLAKAAQPIVFRPGWPLGSPGCRAGL
ncbi:hypothetical protein [Bradyrhizobium guangdongense]|uniref:Uncharacterized protein n=1 Tax=Bradyrhizobium guangdongense TaxID=1325090 RepID=A0A410V9D9_9BRAD|nr:hypothetical protein [Bradyrhizobium guangdongense]QAU40264.1 hypothetical protein X265_23260 [Bradyrhizobium guangdongense]QOZ61329.1 hypothetical protein XH86_23285 [Bradyrhizobium guangdongense]GGI22898.1 hypothetical protein GCM10010987_21700 [Bradyrhizobium guangdongense]